MKKKTHLLNSPYILPSFLLFLCLLNPVHKVQAAQEKNCHYICLHPLKGSGSQGSRLNSCIDKCENERKIKAISQPLM